MAGPLKFSEKFLDKFGSIVFRELAKEEKIFGYYRKLHGKDRAKTNIRWWLKKQLENSSLRDIVAENKWDEACRRGDYDFVAHEALKWVKNHLTYKRDYEVWNQREYWQTVSETLFRDTGDCEDGSILLFCLCVTAGIPKNRIALEWGEVVGGGHCYVVYRRDYDAVRVVLDWCYWYTPIIIKLREWIGLKKKYLSVWGRVR